jgi:hypothetical protein
MLNIIKTLLVKSIAKDGIKMVLRNQNNDSVVKEKLGVNSIDEFMKMDYREFQEKKG